jgi:subtilase family serine protease
MPKASKSSASVDQGTWALDAASGVEAAHALAPGANILLVQTPTVSPGTTQGFPQLMAATKYVVDHHLADVISLGFGSPEGAFSISAIADLRAALIDAATNHVTVLAASGDNGSANVVKTPGAHGGSTVTVQGVDWPASDPLVTGVGGTSLCTDPNSTSTRVTDNVDPPAACDAPGEAEPGWTFSGGGFSHVFSRPAYQDTLPAGSTTIASGQRGVPDVALQANPRTGALIYVSSPPVGSGGLICPDAQPCSVGWYDIGGTSLASPQWAGLVAIADQIRGGGLGPIDAALYHVGTDPARYASDFFDITVGNNQTDPNIDGYSASAGWDPVTGLGTPNAAQLLPDLVAASL